MAPSPSYVVKFETGAATHVGKVRRANEDSYIVLPELGIWAVADGVGGHEGGQFASQTVAGDIASVGVAVSASDQLARFKDRVMRANFPASKYLTPGGLRRDVPWWKLWDPDW